MHHASFVVRLPAATGTTLGTDVVGFAKVRLTDYRLPAENRISAYSLAFGECADPNSRPPKTSSGVVFEASALANVMSWLAAIVQLPADTRPA